MQSCGQGRLASLVAHHSEAQFEAHLRGLLSKLDALPRQCSPLSHVLTYCDITTSPIGQAITLKERIADIFNRYDETDVVSQAIHQAVPSLSLAVERTQTKLNMQHSAKRKSAIIMALVE